MNLELAATYDRIAEAWHQDHQSDDWWVEGTNAFVSLLPSGGRVLDVGCADGVKSKYLLDRGLAVTGIDISEKLLEIARRDAPQGTYQLLAMEELDSLEAKFDGVFAQASLLHIAKKDASGVVTAMSRRLVPGGYLYVAVKEVRPGKPEEGIQQENDYGMEFERFFSYFTETELKVYFEEVGLEVIKTLRDPSPSGKTVWLQIIGKK